MTTGSRLLVVKPACRRAAFRLAEYTDRLHQHTPWHISRLLPLLGVARLDADLGTADLLMSVIRADGQAAVAVNTRLLGTPLEGVALAIAGGRVLGRRYGHPDCSDKAVEWAWAARAAVPDAMARAVFAGHVCPARLARDCGVPLALVQLKLAITSHDELTWGTPAYLDARDTAVACWVSWLVEAGNQARLSLYDVVQRLSA